MEEQYNSFRVNMERRVVYQYPSSPEEQLLLAIKHQMMVLTATYHEIVMKLDAMKLDAMKFARLAPCTVALRKEYMDSYKEICRALAIVSKHSSKYGVHIRNNAPEIKAINQCIENFIDSK